MIEDSGRENSVLAPEFTEQDNVVRFFGDRNKITVGQNCDVKTTTVLFYGVGNRLVIGDNSRVNGASIVFDGQENLLLIGDHVLIWDTFSVAAKGSACKVVIGNECLFSNHVKIRSSDSHLIFDLSSGVLLNPARDIILGDRIWVGEDVHILKGAEIGNDSIIGAGSVVTGKVFPSNSVIAGNPARVIKSNVRWKI
jgi:acetyltransferase-like isoleucine patch superfamily enzyme